MTKEEHANVLAALETCKTGGYRDIDGDWCKRQVFDEPAVAEAIAIMRKEPEPQPCPNGEPGDWNGADPVRKLVAERDTYKKDAEKWASKVMAVVDIYFDGTENPPEHRAYVDGAFPATMNDLRIAIAKGVA